MRHDIVENPSPNLPPPGKKRYAILLFAITIGVVLIVGMMIYVYRRSIVPEPENRIRTGQIGSYPGTRIAKTRKHENRPRHFRAFVLS